MLKIKDNKDKINAIVESILDPPFSPLPRPRLTATPKNFIRETLPIIARRFTIKPVIELIIASQLFNWFMISPPFFKGL